MAPTTPATGAVASPVVTSQGKAAAGSVGLGLPALPPLPGLGLASHGQPRVASFCEWLRTCAVQRWAFVTRPERRCFTRSNVHFCRQAAREERGVHGRGGPVGASGGQRGAHRARQRLETGGAHARLHVLSLYSAVAWLWRDISLLLCVQWDRIEDKYAVTTLAVAATLGMWSAGGVVSVLNHQSIIFF